MKKIILIVGLAFGCSAVYAQGVQTGDNNTAIINTDAADNANSKVTVTQLEGNQRVFITQGPDNPGTLGGELVVTTRQRNIGAVSPALGNFMEIMQAGTGNIISADQLGRRQFAFITQMQDANDSRITTSQSGERNLIRVEQRNGQGFRAIIRQGANIGNAQFNNPPTLFPSLASTIRNTAELYQGGSFSGSGRAEINQRGTAGYAFVTQQGGSTTQNRLEIFQNNNGGTEVEQNGNNNDINISQSSFQAAIVKQGATSSNGDVTIAQGDLGNDTNDTRNSAIVEQRMGDENEAIVTQNDVSSEKNFATIIQSGSKAGAGTRSTVTIDQSGKSSTAEVNQLPGGRNNDATITQTNSQLRAGSEARLDQSGTDNTFESTQDGNGNSVGGTVSAGPGGFTTGRASQKGERNLTLVLQDGSKNQAAVSQDGSDNLIDIDQQSEDFNADGNKATAMQGQTSTDSNIGIIQGNGIDEGDGNVAEVLQTRGDNNNATVNQLNKNTAKVTQSGDEDAATSTGSTVDIDQSESTNGKATATQTAQTFGGTIEIRQEKEDNTATVTQQDGRLNTALVVQTDDGNTATVTQSGTEDAPPGGTPISDVTVRQNGKMSIATVTQASDGSAVTIRQNSSDEATVDQVINGANNSVDIDQEGTLAGTGNSAKVTQGGDENTFDVTQASLTGLDGNTVVGTQMGSLNQTTINQDGPKNQSTVNQDGEENTITIDQDSEAASGKPNVASATQGSTTADNIISIDQRVGQEGGNTATVNQTKGDNNSAIVVQLKDNTATITQSGDDDDFSGMGTMAVVDQSGSTGGTATVNQADGSFGGSAMIIQEDLGNTATINQLAGIQNLSTVSQIGEKNEATVNQSGSRNLPAFASSSADVLQIGNSNKATATQALGTVGGQIAIFQFGINAPVIGNVATVNQTEGTGNVALILQNDDNNTASVTQSGSLEAGTGNASTVVVAQAGKKGTVTVTQAADGSTIDAEQTNGNENKATIAQADLGRANNATTRQAGDKNTLTLNQAGQENDAFINQRNLIDPMNPSNGASEHTATLNQSGTINQAVISQSGFENTADLTQAGEQNFATTVQYGSDNKATTNQTTPLRNNSVNITQGRITNTGGSAATDLATARTNRDATAVNQVLANDLNETNTQQSEGNTAMVNQTAGKNQTVNLFQPGDKETATITQTGSDNTNRSVQAGEMDVLTTTQSGSQGLINVSQYGEETQTGNTATITQAGSNNTIDAGQIKFGNTLTYNQSGSNNNATGGVIGGIVRQIGEANTANVTQSGMRGNINVIQGDAAGTTFGGQTLGSTGYDPIVNDAFTNTATVTQSGLDNIAASRQSGDKGTSTIMQAGANNTAGIAQENVGAVRSMNNKATATQETGTDNNVIDITQSGQQNMATAEQKGNVARSDINLLQRKDNSVAMLTQSQGDRNTINVRQIPDNFDTSPNSVTISQAGSDNKARLEQTGFKNTFSLTQTGNQHTLQQNGGNPFALQSGNNNVAMLTQAGNTDALAGGHTINFNQSGTQNKATIDQSGEGSNTITLVQRDDKNTATLTQNEGSGNVINVNQNPDNAGTVGGMVMITQTGGSDNKARLDQTGKENELTLTQNGDRNILQLSAVTQTAIQSGDDNTATLSQTGEDHVINFNQGGLHNTATITQMNL